MNADKITIQSFFQADHDRLDSHFKQFQAKKSADFRIAKENFKTFLFGLRRHIVWEEEILFPVFEEITGVSSGGPTDVMRLEHIEIKGFLEAIHGKVRQGDTDTSAEEAALLEVLGGHNQKEENILYPMIDQLISEKERTDILTRIRNTPETDAHSCCGLSAE